MSVIAKSINNVLLSERFTESERLMELFDYKKEVDLVLCLAIHKKNMAKIKEHFDYAYISRVRGIDETSESWAIWLKRTTHYQEDNEKQFQAENCSVCGNYKLSNTYSVRYKEIKKFEDLKYRNREEYNDIICKLSFNKIPVKVRCYCH